MTLATRQVQFLAILFAAAVLPFVVHVAFLRLFPGFRTPDRRQRGVMGSGLAGFLLFAFGLAGTASLPAGYPRWSSAELLYLQSLYLAAAYIYFHFFNMSETARRIRMIVAASQDQRLEPREAAADRHLGQLIQNRLDRLVAIKELTVREGRYFIGRGLLIVPAKIMTRLRNTLFPEVANDSAAPWRRIALLYFVTLCLAAAEHQGYFSIPPYEWLALTLIGGLAGVSSFIMLSRRSCPENYVLAALPFLSATFGFIISADIPARDTSSFHFPFFQWIADAAANGFGVPGWIPIEGGIDVSFYHINNFPFLPSRLAGYLIYALFPVSLPTAFKLQMVLGVLFFAWGVYAVTAQLTKSQPAAYWAALCASLGGTGITFHQEQVIATCHLIPWFTLCLLKMREKPAFVLPAGALFALGLSTHYPQIQIISMGLIAGTILLCRPPGMANAITMSKRFAPWLVLLTLLGSLPSLNIWRHSDELAGAMRNMRDLRPASYEEYYDMNILQQSSAPPWYFRQYLRLAKSDDPDIMSDVNGLFVGRPTLLLAATAILLRPAMAVPVAIFMAVAAELTLGINSHLSLPRLLFAARFPFIDVFRQWYHFFPLINFSLAILAGISIQRITEGGTTPGGRRLRRWAMALLVALNCADLIPYDRGYLQTWCAQSPEYAGTSQGFTPFQYKARFELLKADPSALPNSAFITTWYSGTNTGIEAEQALASQLSRQSRVITNRLEDAAADGTDQPPYMAAVDGDVTPKGLAYLIDTPVKALLVSTVNYALGTQALVNGNPTEIRRINSVLSGVMIDAGKNEVSFEKKAGIYPAILCAHLGLYGFAVCAILCLMLL